VAGEATRGATEGRRRALTAADGASKAETSSSSRRLLEGDGGCVLEVGSRRAGLLLREEPLLVWRLESERESGCVMGTASVLCGPVCEAISEAVIDAEVEMPLALWVVGMAAEAGTDVRDGGVDVEAEKVGCEAGASMVRSDENEVALKCLGTGLNPSCEFITVN